jgi:L-asparaginase/Glu-tRNA(Gln) amidotransferase subunit D
MRRLKMLLAVALAVALPALAAKPKVVILATGGTIAGAQAAGQDAGYKSGSFQVEDLIKAVPPWVTSPTSAASRWSTSAVRT